MSFPAILAYAGQALAVRLRLYIRLTLILPIACTVLGTVTVQLHAQEEPDFIPVFRNPVRQQTLDLAWADMDGDGDLDLATAANEL